MQAVNIECQIAQAQLRRYLTGEDMPNAVVNELETHLRNCTGCMAAAQTLRESLKGVLSNKITGKPQPQPKREEPKPQPAMAQAVTAGKAAVQTPADVFDAPDEQFKHTPSKKKAANTKTLLYSGGLALILVLMSTVFKDPTTLFGPRAASTRPDTPAKAKAQEPAPTKPEPQTADPKPETTLQPATTETTSDPTGQATTTANPPAATNGGPGAATPKLETDGLLIADGSKGTAVVKKDPPKQQPKPQPKPQAKRTPRKSSGNGVGTIKVYPPN